VRRRETGVQTRSSEKPILGGASIKGKFLFGKRVFCWDIGAEQRLTVARRQRYRALVARKPSDIEGKERPHTYTALGQAYPGRERCATFKFDLCSVAAVSTVTP
jgi:hypothetical protein